MRHRVAVVSGDGIGKEMVPEAVRVLERAEEIWGFGFDWTFFDWGCEYFLKTGRKMTETSERSYLAVRHSLQSRYRALVPS